MTVTCVCMTCCAPAGANHANDEQNAATTKKPLQQDSAEPQAGVAVYVGEKIIRNYHPETTLVIEEHPVESAKYPAVDVHCHWSLKEEPSELLAAMDQRKIQRAVNLSGGWGEKLDRMLERFAAVAPDRLLIFCNLDFSRINEPNFGGKMAAFIREAHSRGVAGLKIYKSLGLRIRDQNGRLVAIDDSRLDPVWAVCGELNLPVLMHTADPKAFFQPVDKKNERWMQLQRHPNWSFFGRKYPTRAQLFAQRNRVLKRHPETTFIGPHMGGHAGNLKAAADALDKHPNFYMDISGRVAELGRQPYTARRFFIAYQDRILFGSDRYPGKTTQPRYRIYYRFLQTDDEYFDYYDHSFPPAGEWKIYGLFLPDKVLKKIYHTNPGRIFRRTREEIHHGATLSDTEQETMREKEGKNMDSK